MSKFIIVNDVTPNRCTVVSGIYSNEDAAREAFDFDGCDDLHQIMTIDTGAGLDVGQRLHHRDGVAWLAE